MTRLPAPFFEGAFLHRAMAAVSLLECTRTVVGGDFNWDGLHLPQKGTRVERRAGVLLRCPPVFEALLYRYC